MSLQATDIAGDVAPGNNRSQATKTKKNSKKKQVSSNNSSNTRFSSFQGKTTDIKDHVYDTGPQSKDVFTRTTKEIAKYIACNHKGGGEFINAMNPDSLGFEKLKEPDDADPKDAIAFEKWKAELK